MIRNSFFIIFMATYYSYKESIIMKLKTLTTIAVVFSCVALAPLTAQDAKEGTLDVPPVTVIQNVHVWDGTSDTLKKSHDVLIVGDKIRKVAPDIPTEGTVEVDAVRRTMKRVSFTPALMRRVSRAETISSASLTRMEKWRKLLLRSMSSTARGGT